MSLKLKIRSMFPALVSVTSPLLLVKTGLAYTFGFDVAALKTSIFPLDVPYNDQITFEAANTSASHGPFVAKVTDAGNPYLYIGYNIVPDRWGFINPLDRALFFGQEADYNDGTGQNKMEQYWQYQFTAGFGGAGTATYRRTIMTQYNKVTNLPTALLFGSGAPNGITFGWNDGTGAEAPDQVTGKVKMRMLDTTFTVYNQPGSATAGLTVDTTPALSATGLSLNCFAAGSGLHLQVSSSGTNESAYIDAKGSGQILLGSALNGITSVGAAIVGGDATNRGNLTVYSNQTDAAINGVEFKASSAGSGYGFRIPTVFDGSGSMDLKIQSRQNSAAWTDVFKFAGSNGAMLSVSPTGGLGYGVGAGGAVTQITGRTTGVTLNKVCGAITLVSAAGSATAASFTVANSAVAATDVIDVCQKSGTDLYQVFVTAVAAGSFRITFFTTGGTTTEQPVFNFAVTKAVAS